MSKGQLLMLNADLIVSCDTKTLFEKMRQESDFTDFTKTQQLFDGTLDEESFWQEVKSLSGVDDYTLNGWREWWRQERGMKKESRSLEKWRKEVNLGLFGTTFAPWIRETLKDNDVLRHIRYLWLSSETKQILPDPDVFSAPLALGLETLCVDDSKESLEIAKMYGFSVLDPGEEKNWVKGINHWIS